MRHRKFRKHFRLLILSGSLQFVTIACLNVLSFTDYLKMSSIPANTRARHALQCSAESVPAASATGNGAEVRPVLLLLRVACAEVTSSAARAKVLHVGCGVVVGGVFGVVLG